MGSRWRVWSVIDPRWDASGYCAVGDESYFLYAAKASLKDSLGSPPVDLTESYNPDDSGTLVRGLDDLNMDPSGPAIQSIPNHPRWTHVPSREEVENGYFTRKVW